MLTIYEFREGALKAQTGLHRITEEAVWIDLFNPTAEEEEIVERSADGAEPGFEVHMTGGHFKAPTLSLSGERSAEFFAGLFAEKLFLATAALDIDGGLTYPSLSDIAVKRAMIGSAQQVYLVADSSKIGQRSFCMLGGLNDIDVLITDDGIGKVK